MALVTLTRSRLVGAGHVPIRIRRLEDQVVRAMCWWAPLDGDLRSKSALEQATMLTGSGAVRFAEGPWSGSQSAVVEEATTNVCTNPSFEANTTSWYKWDDVGAGAASTMSRVEGGVFGDYCLRHGITAGGTTSSHVQLNWSVLPVLQGQVYACSIYAHTLGGTRPFYIRLCKHTSPWTNFGHITPTLTEEWQRFTWLVTVTENCDARINCLIGNNTTDYEIDACQIELKGYHSSYCDGSLGTGYSWSGTAHGSASSRGAARLISYNPPINPLRGAALMWINPHNRPTATGGRVWFLRTGVGPAHPCVLTPNRASNDRIALNHYNSLAWVEATSVDGPAVGSWAAVYAEWQPDLQRLVIGSHEAYNPYPAFEGSGCFVTLGGDHNPLNHANVKIAGAMFFRRPLTGCELAYLTDLERSPVWEEV